MGYDVVVANIGETRILDARNQPVRVYRFTFNVGSHGPFTKEFTDQQVSDGTARQEMQKFANQLQAAAS